MTDYVVSSGTSSGGFTLSAGDTLTVLNGGTVNNIIVLNGAVETISSGGIASDTTVRFGGIAIDDGGLVVGTTVSAKGQLNISSGVGSGTTLTNGGTESVLSGGSAVSTTILNASVEAVYSGGTVISSQVQEGGTLIQVPSGIATDPALNGGVEITSGYVVLLASGGVSATAPGSAVSGQIVQSGLPGFVLSGGRFESGYIAPGAQLEVYSGGLASAVIDYASGVLGVFASGSAASTTVLSGGLEEALSGGSVFSASALSGGYLYLNGGTGTDLLIADSGSELLIASGGTGTSIEGTDHGEVQILAGGSAVETTLSTGGELIIGSGGAAVLTFLESGTSAFVLSGGLISSFLVFSGATVVLSAGSSLYATVNSGATQIVASGGLANGSEIDGNQIVSSGGDSIAVAVVSGGNLFVDAGGSAGDALVVSGGYVEVRSGGTLSGIVISGGGLAIADAGAMLSGGVTFGDTNGEYATSNTTALTQVNDFQEGDLLVAASLAFVSAGSATLGSDDVLTVTQGTGTFSVQFDSTVTGDTFAWSADSEAGTDIYLVPNVISITSANSPYDSATVSATEVLDVLGSGVVNNARVNNGGAVDVLSGGSANDSFILAGGVQTVFSGGAAASAYLEPGASEIVSSGGVTSNAEVFGGSTEEVLAGGSGFGIELGQPYGEGGTMSAVSGAVLSGTLIYRGGTLTVSGGADVSATTVDGGTLVLSAGAVASGVTDNSGNIEIASGGTLVDPVVSAGALFVSNGATLVNPETRGGVIVLLPGGKISGTVASGTDIISSGALLFSNGELVSQGAVIDYLDIPYQGSPLIVLPGGQTSDTRVYNGGLETLYGGVASGSDLTGGGTQSVGAEAAAVATQIQAGGIEVVASGGVLSGNVYFTGAGGELVTYNDTPGTVLSGFNDTDLLDAAGLTFSAAGSGMLSANDVLTVSEGGQVFSAQFFSGAANATFGWTSDGKGGTLIRFISDTLMVTAGNSPVSGVTLLAGDDIDVGSGGVTSDTVISSGGAEYVSAGGSAVATSLTYLANQYVLSGGTVSGTIFDYGTQHIESGAVDSGGAVGFGGTEMIASGGSAVSVTLTNGGNLQVLSGGAATGTTVGVSADETVFSGGVESGGTVLYAGVLNISSGGSAVSVTLLDGNSTTVSSGGVAIGTILQAGAGLGVQSGALVISTVVASGGSDTLVAGAADSGTVVQAFGTEVLSGGTSYETVVDSGGQEQVSSGGVASNTEIASGGLLIVSSGGVAYNPEIASGGAVLVLAGGMISGAVSGAGEVISTGAALVAPGLGIVSQGASFSNVSVALGQTDYVLSGGTTTSTQVAPGGLEFIDAGGIASGTVLNAQTANEDLPYQATEHVASGGLAIGTDEQLDTPIQVASGGVVSNVLDQAGEGFSYLSLTGEAFNTTINNGNVYVLSGGVMSDTVVEGTGQGIKLFSGGVCYGTTVETNGLIEVTGGILSNTVIEGGYVEVPAGGTSGTLQFEGTGGTLLEDYSAVDTVLSGFVPGDTIGIYGYVSGVTATLTGDVLTAFVAGRTYTNYLDPNIDYSQDTVSLGVVEFPIINGVLYEALYDTTITLEAACYARGTRVRTADGEVAVEALRVGELARTQSGALRPVKWIGFREYDGRFIAGNHLMLPVRICRDALAAGVPARDLVVSPGHGICLGGVIVPAWRLINGVSITQAETVERIAYFHVELDTHDIIFANGCAAESFLDNGCRGQFANAAEYAGDAAPGESCLERVEDGFRLWALQRRLAARAGVPALPEVVGPLRGFVDEGGAGGLITGWAQDVARPEAPVALEVLADGRRVGCVLANGYRADLRKAGLGSGCHGFQAAYPAGAKGRVEVRRMADQAPLGWTAAAATRMAVRRS